MHLECWGSFFLTVRIDVWVVVVEVSSCPSGWARRMMKVVHPLYFS